MDNKYFRACVSIVIEQSKNLPSNIRLVKIGRFYIHKSANAYYAWLQWGNDFEQEKFLFLDSAYNAPHFKELLEKLVDNAKKYNWNNQVSLNLQEIK